MKSEIRNKLSPACIALASALLFGASTPAAKLLSGQVDPQLLAGLLYFSSGLGLLLLSVALKIFRGAKTHAHLKQSDLPWLSGAIVSGGIIGPLLLMIGLTSTQAGAASLLLNMESVLTALLAWYAFKENFDRRIFLGMVSIVVGSVFLTWQHGAAIPVSIGSLSIIGACLCWAIDNSLTRHISDSDPMQIAIIKGLVAGSANISIALLSNNHLPGVLTLIQVSLIGFLGYGVSLVLFINSLSYLGTARTGAYFSTAPFAGAILSLVFLHENPTINLLAAAGFMAFGVWLHLTENHEHEHSHEEEEHEHMHVHDEHHQHEHDTDITLGEPHSHWHRHVAITHSHPHYPDTQHRHEH